MSYYIRGGIEMNAEEISNFINKKSIAAINSMKWAHNAQKFDMQDKNHLFWKAYRQKCYCYTEYNTKWICL